MNMDAMGRKQIDDLSTVRALLGGRLPATKDADELSGFTATLLSCCSICTGVGVFSKLSLYWRERSHFLEVSLLL